MKSEEEMQTEGRKILKLREAARHNPIHKNRREAEAQATLTEIATNGEVPTK